MRIKASDRKAVEKLAKSVPAEPGYDSLYPSVPRRAVEIIGLFADDLAAKGIAVSLEVPDTPDEAAGRLVAGHGLTAAEARLALFLASGGSLAGYAAVQKVSRNTARTHLQRIFQKMGVGRQAELVRLVLGVLKG